MLALLHRLFQFFPVIGKQSMDLTVRFVADCVNLRAKILTRGVGTLIDRRVNLVVAPLKQGPDLLSLFWRQRQIIRKAS